MKICSYCGAKCEDKDIFCNSCGTAFPPDDAQQQAQQPQYGQYDNIPPHYQQGQYYNNPYQNPNPYQPYPGMGRNAPIKRSAPLVLGIIGLFFAVWFPLITCCCSIPGLVIATKDLNMGAQGRGYQLINIAALALAVISFIARIMLNISLIFY